MASPTQMCDDRDEAACGATAEQVLTHTVLWHSIWLTDCSPHVKQILTTAERSDMQNNAVILLPTVGDALSVYTTYDALF